MVEAPAFGKAGRIMRRSPTFLVLLTLAGSAALAGCGESDESDDDRLNRIARSTYGLVRADLSKLCDDLDAAGEAALKERHVIVARPKRLAVRAGEMVGRLGDVVVPAELLRERDELQMAVDEVGTDLYDIADATKHNQHAAGELATEYLGRDTYDVRRAKRYFEEKLAALPR